MFKIAGSSFLKAGYLAIAISGIIFALFGDILPPGLNISTSAVGSTIRKGLNVIYRPSLSNDDHQYQVQIFSREPLIVHIRDFLSSDEIAHLNYLSQDKYEPSKVYGGVEESLVNRKLRVSEVAYLDRKDPIVRRITKRAREFQGWRGNSTFVEPLVMQRYHVDGFYSYHFDWDEYMTEGNRATTFMVYVVADCTGGGTNFPFLPQPNDTRWCDITECDEEAKDGYQGVTFKPLAGSALFWENIRLNGSLDTSVYHAGLPIKSGTKVGLNIWSWDSSWRRPEVTV